MREETPNGAKQGDGCDAGMAADPHSLTFGIGAALAYPFMEDSYTVGNTIHLFDWVFMALGLCPPGTMAAR